MLDQSLVSGKSFRDDKHFPHGFSRSGNFSRLEAELLTRGGKVASALACGELSPACETHSHLLEVCRGERDAETEFERVWLKYVNLSGKKRSVFSFASSGNLASNDCRFSAADILG